jgi:NAD(P)-dependent dehydrogenase (short-subunit alcohol dehydrogenase family)
MDRLAGKVAVITGGSSGIGEASVRLFVAEGAKVIIADIQDEKGERLAAELGSTARYIHTDVIYEDQVKAAVDLAVSHFGGLDCIFNNAGFPGENGGIADLTADGFDLTVDILLRGPFFGMKHAAPIMVQQGSGSIISTASVAGIMTGAAGHLYSMAKAGVIHLTHSVASELGESGVRVNCICPGGIATPIFGKNFGLSTEDADQTVEAVKSLLARSQPIKRSGLPEDIAHAALWLASDDSTFVTSHALVVDGGQTGGISWSQAAKGARALARAMNINTD